MYQNVLIPVDLAEASSWHKALPAAIEICQASGGTLDLQDTGPQAGFASVATSMDVGAFDIADVVGMDVNLGSSGGVDDVTFNNL